MEKVKLTEKFREYIEGVVEDYLSELSSETDDEEEEIAEIVSRMTNDCDDGSFYAIYLSDAVTEEALEQLGTTLEEYKEEHGSEWQYDLSDDMCDLWDDTIIYADECFENLGFNV